MLDKITNQRKLWFSIAYLIISLEQKEEIGEPQTKDIRNVLCRVGLKSTSLKIEKSIVAILAKHQF